MIDATDQELLARFAAGDGRAFDDIVTKYERRVFSIALRMCGDREDARDVTQDVFVNAMRALKRFRGDAQLGTWFHRVATNASLDHLRKNRKRVHRPIDEVTEVATSEPGPDDRALGSARAAAVQEALRQLSPDHRAAMVLVDIHGLDYAEAAESLGIPVGTVKSRMHRARLEMAKMLGHLRETEPSGPPTPLREEP
ncbi:MAG TPA: sigma-70 family RNA polymerase sigma factor [Actinomycetota bacterium]|nr:sigma-70 family RNA polymerase sigma factor [Actinomycetota bacterium]